ncbi:MAG: ATP-binding cassette domain-containing protein [Burkholderiaceae bacterium]
MLRIAELGSNMFGPVSIDVAAGECVAIRGASGAGKSVLLRAIADLDPTTGDVFLNSQSRQSMRATQWRSQVMLVPAQPGWWADQVNDHFEPGDRESVEGLSSALDLPPDCWNWSVDRLSSGEAQRLAIIRAVVRQPKVLLLDEPTASLDGETTRRVEKLIKQLLSAGRALLVVTHDADQAVRIARRRFTVDAGQLNAE